MRALKAKRIEWSYYRDRRHDPVTDAAGANSTTRSDASVALRFEQSKATHMRERANV